MPKTDLDPPEANHRLQVVQAQNARMREALRMFADDANWQEAYIEGRGPEWPPASVWINSADPKSLADQAIYEADEDSVPKEIPENPTRP